MTDESEVPAEKLAKVYIKIRDKRAELKEKYDAEDSILKEQMEMIANSMLELCEAQGVSSLKTKAGTIVRRVFTRYWTNDWESFNEFVKDNDAYPLFEQRIHQTNMKQFLEENPDLLPAGLQSDSKYIIVVRRS